MLKVPKYTKNTFQSYSKCANKLKPPTYVKVSTAALAYIPRQVSYLSRSTMCSRLLKRSDMHHRAQRPTTVYIMRLISASCPPKIQATISKLKIPMLPQFIPPIISSERVILSSILKYQSFYKITPQIGKCFPSAVLFCACVNRIIRL